MHDMEATRSIHKTIVPLSLVQSPAYVEPPKNMLDRTNWTAEQPDEQKIVHIGIKSKQVT